MRPRLSISLWFYILTELWRLILLTAGVLVAVLAFAAAIKPLADGKIGPLETLRFMGLAIIPMLQYALPFAAGFGATLAYHRLSQENEIIAAHAGGVSHRAIVFPAVVSGLVLAGMLLLLSEQVMPRFLRSMERMISQDIAKILVSSVQRGQAVDMEGMTLYADKALRIDPAPGSPASDEILLTGVGLLELNRAGEVMSDATVEKARVWIFSGGNERDSDAPDVAADSGSGSGSGAGSGSGSQRPTAPGSQTSIVLRLENFVGRNRAGQFVKSQVQDMALTVPGGFSDDPKFLTHGELADLRTHPERMNWIELRRRDLAYHLGERLTTEAIGRSLAATGSVTLVDPDGRTLVVKGSAISLKGLRWDIVPARPGEMIEVLITRPAPDPARTGGAAAMRVLAKAAAIYTDIGRDRATRRLSIRLKLEQVAAQAGEGASGTLTERVYEDLTLQNSPVLPLLDLRQSPSSKLLELADARVSGPNPDPFLIPPTTELRAKLERLQREITSKQNERYAMAAACLVMVSTGAVTAINLSSSLPLTVYLWSFFPALATIITISSGQQVTHDKGLWGLVILWGGVALLAAYGLFAFRRLTRH